MLNVQSQAQIFDLIYPIGSIYISATLTTVEQVQALFGGKWELFGEGRCLVGKSTETEFNTLLKTGGEATHTLTTSEMPSHRHRLLSAANYSTNCNGLTGYNTTQVGGIANSNGTEVYCDISASSNNALGSNVPYVENTGGGKSHNNLQPYIVVSMFRRTELGGGINYYAYCFLILLKGGK